jgi:hypothetical protein
MDSNPAWKIQSIRETAALQNLERAKVPWEKLGTAKAGDSIALHILAANQNIITFLELECVVASPLIGLFLLQILRVCHRVTHASDQVHTGRHKLVDATPDIRLLDSIQLGGKGLPSPSPSKVGFIPHETKRKRRVTHTIQVKRGEPRRSMNAVVDGELNHRK